MKSTIGKFVVITIGILVIIIIYLCFKNYTLSLKVKSMNNEMSNLLLTCDKNKVSKRDKSNSLSKEFVTNNVESDNAESENEESYLSSDLNRSEFIENYVNDNITLSNDKEMIIPININTLLQKAIEEQMVPVMMHCMNDASLFSLNGNNNIDGGMPPASVKILNDYDVSYNTELIDEFFRSENNNDCDHNYAGILNDHLVDCPSKANSDSELSQKSPKSSEETSESLTSSEGSASVHSDDKQTVMSDSSESSESNIISGITNSNNIQNVEYHETIQDKCNEIATYKGLTSVELKKKNISCLKDIARQLSLKLNEGSKPKNKDRLITDIINKLNENI